MQAVSMKNIADIGSLILPLDKNMTGILRQRAVIQVRDFLKMDKKALAEFSNFFYGQTGKNSITIGQ